MDGGNLLDHICNFIGIRYDYFFCFFTSQIGKLFQHFLCGPQIKRCLIICILKTTSCHDDPAVYLILGIHKMDITGSNYRLIKLLSQLNDFLIDLDQILIGMDRIIFFILYHKLVVAKRLDFQIIIKAYQSCDLLLRCITKQCLIQFPCFTGASNKKPFPVSLKYTFGHTGPMVKIFNVRLAHKLIQINTTSLIPHKNNRMIGRQLLNSIWGNLPLFIQLVNIRNVSFTAHSHKLLKNTGRAFSIINCTMVMIQRNSHRFCYSVKLETVQCRQ